MKGLFVEYCSPPPISIVNGMGIEDAGLSGSGGLMGSINYSAAGDGLPGRGEAFESTT